MTTTQRRAALFQPCPYASDASGSHLLKVVVAHPTIHVICLRCEAEHGVSATDIERFIMDKASAPRASFTERFEWFVRGAITNERYHSAADMVREDLAKYGIRQLLKRAGRGGLGRWDWNDIARWFLNATRAKREEEDTRP